MTLVAKTPRETDIVVDAPFQWIAFHRAHRTATSQDQPLPPFVDITNATGDNSDIVRYSTPPNFFLDR